MYDRDDDVRILIHIHITMNTRASCHVPPNNQQEDIQASIAANNKKLAAVEKAKYASPPGVPPPPRVPVIDAGTFGFVENAERMNSRASMVGWCALLIVELVAGKGLLEIMGYAVGKGINFTF